MARVPSAQEHAGSHFGVTWTTEPVHSRHDGISLAYYPAITGRCAQALHIFCRSQPSFRQAKNETKGPCAWYPSMLQYSRIAVLVDILKDDGAPDTEAGRKCQQPPHIPIHLPALTSHFALASFCFSRETRPCMTMPVGLKTD
jgi:hypothetical protein